MIVDVDVLSDGLIWIQRGHFAIDYRRGTLYRCLDELLIQFDDCAVLLNSLEVRLARERLKSLELFVPLVVELWVEAEHRIDRLPDALEVGHLNLLLTGHDPVSDWLCDGRDEVWLALEDRAQVALQVPREAIGKLVQAPSQCVAKAGIGSL